MSGVVNQESIIVHNATENNLKNITVSFPLGRFTCVTGPSGCGKSSLIYDTLYAESQRNFLESMTGNLYGQKLMDKPAVDSIDNLRPALNVSQTYYNVNPRSTIGTVTDVSYFLRTLFAFVYNQENDSSVDMNYFSANNPSACCKRCGGLGEEYTISEEALMPDPKKTLASGGIIYYKGTKTSMEYKLLAALCERYGIDINKAVGNLSDYERWVLLYREEECEIPLRFKSTTGKYRQKIIRQKGAMIELLEHLEDVDRPSIFRSIEKYLKKQPCHVCRGLKLNDDRLQVHINGLNITEVEQLSLNQLKDWLNKTRTMYSKVNYYPQIKHLLDSIEHRIALMIDLLLGYLSVGRSIPTLSGGEMQRVRIANQLGCNMAGLVYILDEPCKGLHIGNVVSIIEATKAIVAKGNTVLAIEHNPQYISAADRVIEMGPSGGSNGGYIINETDGKQDFNYDIQFKKKKPYKEYMTMEGITYHNLKNISIHLPIGMVICITGVSGSGKSSLSEVIEECCSKGESSHCRRFSKSGVIKRVQRMNQKPIGKTPRSTVVSYLGIYDAVRDLFASIPQAQRRGLGASDFSMNVSGGRCECCQGTGKKKIELTYLPESYIVCPECKGSRFNEKVLSVKYKGKSINEILNMAISDLLPIFREHQSIYNVLRCLEDIGLGYLSLGQMSMNLSGGEAQRIKLAKCLNMDAKGRGLYILDEPTAGLNKDDITKIENVILKLTQNGETIVIIEHNIEFIARIADYLIDLGVVAGVEGGTHIVEGATEDVIKNSQSSWFSFFNNYKILIDI